MKKIILLGLFLSALQMNAQDDNNDYEVKAGEKQGYIIDKSGKKVEGIVRLNGSTLSPWQNQIKVKFIANSDIDTSKKRQKFKTLDPDDIKEYMLFDNGVERHFESVKYTNTREGLNSSNNTSSFGATFKAINNLTKSQQFVELVTDGKVKVYKIYGYPTSFSANSTQAVSQAETQRLIEHPSFIFSKKGGKVEDLTPAKIKVSLADCPTVKAKMTKNEYGSLKSEEKKRSGLGKFIRNEIENEFTDKENIINEVIYDYNENCK